MALIPKIPLRKTKKKNSPFNALETHCPPTDNITTAQFALIGNAPNNIEILEQIPFVGPVGSQLNRICAAVKLPRYKLYLTHACKSQPPKNNMNKIWTKKGYRCSAWGELQNKLIEELTSFNGTIIICLGETAMRLLIDEPKFNSIDKYRGSIYSTNDFVHLKDRLPNKFIALTYHPSFTFIYKKPISFYIMIADMQKFINFDNDPELINTKLVIKTKPNINEIMQHYELIKTKSIVAFDIECTPEYITCFSLAISHENQLISMSIPFIDNSGNYWSVAEEIEIWNGLARVLINPDIGITCQNGMFDLMFILRTMNIISDNFFFDTMLAQHIIYTELPKGLDFLTSTYTYFPYYKDEGKQSHLAVIKDWQMYWNYNAKDSAYLIPIMEKLQQELTDFNATDAMDYTMSLHKPLMEMEYNGILTNRTEIEKYRSVLQRKITAMQHGLNKIAGKELNINSSKQLIAYFYGILMIKPYINRQSGNATCDAVALSRIARKKIKGSIEAKMIIKIRTYYKLLSTYFNINVDADNKLRCSHKISGTVSGRIATEKTFFGTGANLQNQPYVYKKFLIPDDNYILCEVDLAKAEAHVVAFLTQDANMIEAFESGIDVHSFNAAKVFNVDVDTVLSERRIPGKMTMRDMGKRVVHASNYGMGPQTFSDNLAKENVFQAQSECKKLLIAYANRFPGLHRWHKLIEAEVKETRTLFNLFNRPRRFLGVMNSALFRNAYSYKPQSTVAELLNKGTIKIANDPRLGRDGYDIDLLTTVHDSDVFQFHKSQAKNLLQILLIIQDHMNHTFIYKGRSFTIGLDAKIGFQWAGDTVEIASFTQENVDNALNQIGAS